MDSESESKVETEEQDKKSNAFLVGLALNLGRAARTAKAGLGAIGATASKMGAGVKGLKPAPETSAELETGEELPDDGDKEPESKEKKKDKKKKECLATSH